MPTTIADLLTDGFRRIVFDHLFNHLWGVAHESTRRFCGALLFAGALNAQDSAGKEVRKAMDDNFAAIMHKDGAALNRQYTNDYFRIGETGSVSGKTEYIASVV